MAGIIRSALIVAAAGIALAAASDAPAAAQTPASFTPPQTGPRPPFFVPWSASPPGLTARPALRGRARPEYPAESVRDREQGEVRLEVCVTAEGRLADVKLARSSGFPRLDQATLEWAAVAAYSPATFQGQAMAICGYPVAYEWRLDR
jgi:protein TonB